MQSFRVTRRNASTLAATILMACLAPETLRAAIASGAGLALEATPFVAGAGAVNTVLQVFADRGCCRIPPRIGALAAALLGCGCGPVPGALSLPAAAITWYAFGPAVALVRLIAGFLLTLAFVRSGDHHAAEPLDELAAIVVYAFAGSLLSAAFGAVQTYVAMLPIMGFVGGTLAGALSPCAIGAISAAASLRTSSPWTAAGILVTAGFLCRRRVPESVRVAANPRMAAAVLLLATIMVAARGGAALLHPRLVWFAVAGAAVALAASLRKTSGSVSWLAPGAVCAALVLGSPVPRSSANIAWLDGAFAGETVRFTGVVQHRGGEPFLVRFAITCCRADATPLGLRLDRDAGLGTGSWATVDGVFAERGGRLVVRVERLHAVASPQDPFFYR